MRSGRATNARTLVFYGLPNISLSVVHLPLAIYLPALYSQHLGLAFATVGAIIALSRIGDVFTDPVIGVLSDRWKSRFGRRKPFIVAGIPLMIAALWLLYVPPDDVSPLYLFVFVSLVYLANTLIDLPYRAWGAELSTNYRERSRIAGVREGFGIAGVMVALVIPIVMQAAGYPGTLNAVFGIAVATAILLPLLFLPALGFVPQPAREEIPVDRADWKKRFAIVFGNGPFVRVCCAILLLVTPVTMTASLSILFVSHVMAEPARFAMFILLYYTSSFLAVPIWLKLAARYGKHRTTAIAIFWLSLWSIWIPLLGPGDFWIFLFLMLMKGSSVGAIYFLPAAMAADVVDLDTVQSGKQRTGLFFSFWGMVLKGSIAFGVLLATIGTGAMGFDPRCASTAAAIAANPDMCVNTAESLFWLACFYSIIPAVVALSALPFLWNFPITEERQRALREEIARRGGSAPEGVVAEQAG